MGAGKESVLLLAVAERAKQATRLAGGDRPADHFESHKGTMSRNLAGWYCNTELSEREFQVLDTHDFAEWGRHGAIILAAKGASPGSAGGGSAQIWWLDPYCRHCQAGGLLKRIGGSPLWEIACPGHLATGRNDLWHCAMEWISLAQQNQMGGHGRPFPYEID